jgi:hypothetical protein
MVPIKEDGLERSVTAAEAFLLHLTKRGLSGDARAAKATMAAIEAARPARRRGPEIREILVQFVSVGTVNCALEPLRMASKLDRHRPTARIMLEPWLVQLALMRLGERKLSRHEQEVVVRATRTPHKVPWPDWWEIDV